MTRSASWCWLCLLSWVELVAPHDEFNSGSSVYNPHIRVLLQYVARYSGALNSRTSGLAASKPLGTSSTRYSGIMPLLRTYPSIARTWGCLAPVIAALSRQRAPLLSCGGHAFHTQPPSRWPPQSPAHTYHASMRGCRTPSKAPDYPPLGERD